jgi:hypothetical protein
VAVLAVDQQEVDVSVIHDRVELVALDARIALGVRAALDRPLMVDAHLPLVVTYGKS